MKIKIPTIKEVIDSIWLLLAFIPGKILKHLKKDIWIISERPQDAQDNGYHLFKYIVDNMLHDEVYYSIDFKSAGYKKIRKYKLNLIKYASFKHYCYLWACNKYISTQIGSGLPIPRICNILVNKNILNFKNVFLQHGIICNHLDWLDSSKNRIDLFICSTMQEKNFICNDLGYDSQIVKCTGLCRYDNLKNNYDNKKSILFMPTWRASLNYNDKINRKENVRNFLNSRYYKNINELINNDMLHSFLLENNIQFILYLHDNMQNYSDLFKSFSKNILILNKECEDIQFLLNSCLYFITDYSSISFDAAYLLKPIQYFQFDYEDFRKNHYKEGYFHYETNGFGNITYSVEECVNDIIKHYKNDCFILDEFYKRRMLSFFKFHDQLNCYRNFNEINKI